MPHALTVVDRQALGTVGFSDTMQFMGRPAQRFRELTYRTRSTWSRARRVVAKAEQSGDKSNPRFVVTSLAARDWPARELYETLYCARGEMENRIKECQLGLFADRTSCHRWWPNQFRLLLASLGYILMQRIREIGLSGSQLAGAQAETIRTRLLKVGAVIVRNTRRIRFFIASAFPQREAFLGAARRLNSG